MNIALALVLIIIVHELGHVISGTLCRITIDKFCIFLDPFFCIFKTKIKQTEFTIGWLPIGGYLKINEATGTRKQLTIFYLAGIAANIMSGVLILKTQTVSLFVDYSTNNLHLDTFAQTFGFLSILIGIINLIPFNGTDGEKLLKLWR